MLTCTLNKEFQTQHIALPFDGHTVSFYTTVEEVRTEWNQYAGEDVFLHSTFLAALEQAPPSGTQYRYGLIYRADQLIGITYWQLKKIDLYRSLRLDAYQPKDLWDKIWHWTKSLLAKPLRAYLLVNGNMTLTGNHGSNFVPAIDDVNRHQILEGAAEALVCLLRSQKIRTRMILIKDFFEPERLPVAGTSSYTEFQVQPNMIVDIDAEWHSFDDYINGMKSKYRVRVRRARKKAQSLDRRVLSLEEIHSYADDISQLYQNVADQAGFNLFILPQNYFYSLQKHLQDRMTVMGYFEGDRMVGFSTSIMSHGELDAHFLGYDPECNRSCQLYLNMLYDLVEDAIRLRSTRLIMSRTAMEIKSSVGADPHDMYLYMKSPSSILNRGVARALSFFKPDTNWQPRSPFK